LGLRFVRPIFPRRLTNDRDGHPVSLTRNLLSYTEKRIWIECHFDYKFTKKLKLSPDKGLLKGDFLIDDHNDGKGQERFERELIRFGSQLFPDWHSVQVGLDRRGILTGEFPLPGKGKTL
jgi:hypothetical protein